MNISKLFKRKLKEVKVQAETPNLNFHPRLLEYLDKGWAELVKMENGEPFMLDGKRLYEITDPENGLKMNRLFKMNDLFEQASVYGMSKENFEFNERILDGLIQQCIDIRHEERMVLNLCDQMKMNRSAFKIAKSTGLDDELCFSIASLIFVSQDEDPTQFDQALYEKKVRILRQNELGFFFYTRGLKALSSSLKVFMQDTQSFTKEILQQNLKNLNIQMSIIVQSLTSSLSELSNEEYGFYEKQVEILNERIKWLTQMLSISTIGSLPVKN